jgi:hypothetical protein
MSLGKKPVGMGSKWTVFVCFVVLVLLLEPGECEWAGGMTSLWSCYFFNCAKNRFQGFF